MAKKQAIIPSVIKGNLDIKEFLYRRWTDNGLSFSEVIRNAKKMKRKITNSQLSRYVNSKHQASGGLSEQDILWLCNKYNIKVTIKVEYETNFKL